MKHLWLLLLLAGCNLVDSSVPTALVADIPTPAQFADSLNGAGFACSKWTIEGDSTFFTPALATNWLKEFDVLAVDNVNHLRFRDAYTLTDSTSGGLRTVRLQAKTPDTEVQLMEVVLNGKRIVRWLLHRQRANFFSATYQQFLFEENHYEMRMQQSIRGVLQTDSYVYGRLLAANSLWRGEFSLHSAKAPFEFVGAPTEQRIWLVNGDERVPFARRPTTDSLVFESEYYDSEIVFHEANATAAQGVFRNLKNDQPQEIAFTAELSNGQRFWAHVVGGHSLNGTYPLVRTKGQGQKDTLPIAFSQKANQLWATVLSPTGDFRFMAGVVRSDSLLLSSFDGTHVYLLRAAISGSECHGMFQSGLGEPTEVFIDLNKSFEGHWQQNVSPLQDTVKFSFSDADGRDYSFPNADRKPLLLSIMGSWCSNCTDELAVLNEVQRSHGDQLQVIALDFELVSDSAKAWRNASRVQRGLGLNYPVLLAGTSATAENVKATLPWLHEFHAYPTLLLVDADGQLVFYESGFSGPATGEAHKQFRQKLFAEVEQVCARPRQQGRQRSEL